MNMHTQESINITEGGGGGQIFVAFHNHNSVKSHTDVEHVLISFVLLIEDTIILLFL